MSRTRTFLMLTAAAVAVLMAVPAGATPVCTYGNCYFYGGDINANTGVGLANEQDAYVSQAAVYTPFRVVTSPIDVSGLFTMNLTTGFTTQSASWEIRSGVSAGNGGTLIASGTGTPTVTDTGYYPNLGGYEQFEVEMATGGVSLGPGTYWLNVTPICPTCNGRSYNSNTDGSGAIGTPEPPNMAFFNSSYFGTNFENANSEGPYFSLMSSGVETPVPEPATLLLFGSGLVGLIRRRWVA